MFKSLSGSQAVPALLLLLPLLFVLGHPIPALADGSGTGAGMAFPAGSSAVAEDVYNVSHSLDSGSFDQATSVKGFGLPGGGATDQPDPIADPPAPTVNPPDSQTDTVTTAAELQAWFDAHAEGSGAVSLGADIWLYSGDSLCLISADNRTPITIEAGDYHIYVSGGELLLSGYIKLKGEGAGSPLVTEVAKGQISITKGVEITAGGDDASVTGRCALGVFGGAEINDCDFYAYGEGAIGIHFMDDPNAADQQAAITNSGVYVSGADSIAILSEIPFSAASAGITAEGENASSIVAPSFNLTSTYASPAPKPAGNTASNLDELRTWLAYYGAIGGEVTLTGDIAVDPGKLLNMSVTAPVTVDAQGYSIFLNGGYFLLSGDLSLEGGAGDYPLIYDTAGSDFKITNGASVTAQGRCAVYASAYTNINGAYISACGDNAVALYIDKNLANDPTDPLTINASKITVDGPGATAIYSGAPLTATMCVITASGDGAQGIEAPDIQLYCCKVSPQPDSCAICDTAPVPAGDINFWEIPIGYPADQSTLPNEFYVYIGYDLYSYPVQWNTAAVNTGVEGEYQVTGTVTGAPYLPPIASEIGIQPPEPVFTIKVSAPRKPAFDTNSVVFFPWTASLSVDFAEPLDASTVAFYLWDDEQNQWRDITGETGLYIYNKGIHDIPNIYNGQTYGFKIVCSGNGLIQGESDELWVQITNGIAAVVDPGGDRTGTDRDEVKVPDDNGAPEDDVQPGDSDGDNGGNENQPPADNSAPGGGTHGNQSGNDVKAGHNLMSGSGFGISAAEATATENNPAGISPENNQPRNGPSALSLEKDAVLTSAGLPAGLPPDKEQPAALKPEATADTTNRTNTAETTQGATTPANKHSASTPGQSAPAPVFNMSAAIGIPLGAAAVLVIALLWVKQRRTRR